MTNQIVAHKGPKTPLETPAKQLDESPKRKQSKYSQQAQAYMEKAQMDKVKNEKYTAHLQQTPPHVDDHPFNLAVSDSQHGFPGYGLKGAAMHELKKGNNKMTTFKKADMFEAMDRDLQPFQQESSDDFDLPPLDGDIQKPTPQHQNCKKCNKRTIMQSVCQSCGLISFNEIYEQAQQQLHRLQNGSDSLPLSPGDPTLGSVTQKTDIGIGAKEQGFLSNKHGSKRSSHDGSIMKKSRHSLGGRMPFEYAADRNKSQEEEYVDGVSSAGGGEPIETSQHSQNYGAGGYPTEQQRQFILERQSESTQQRPSDAHQKLQIGVPPKISSHQSSLCMPQSLKDSQEEIEAVKNQSRYGDDSVTLNMGPERQGHNITYEHQSKVNRLNLNIESNHHSNARQSLGIEEFKGPSQADSINLRLPRQNQSLHPNSHRPSLNGAGGSQFETSRRPQRGADITPYSFADGLNLNMHAQQNNKYSADRKQASGNHEEYLDDYMLNSAIQRKESVTAKLNPFDVVMEDRVVAEKTAQNRQTSNFGKNLPVANGPAIQTTANYQLLQPRKQITACRPYSQSQEHEQSPQMRQMTTELPDSDYKQIDSARNRLLSSQNDGPGEMAMMVGSHDQPVSSHGFHRSMTSGQRLSSVKQASKNTLQESFVQSEFRRLSLDTQHHGKSKQSEFKSTNEPSLKRKVTMRLTRRQTSLLNDKYSRWRNSLSWKERVKQQESSHKILTPTFSRAQIFLSILTLTFSFLGFLFYFSAAQLKQLVIDYGNECETGVNCRIQLQLTENLDSPLIYYELDSFYSNYRSVVTTLKLYNQLRGEQIDPSDCQDVETVGDLLPNLRAYQNITDFNSLSAQNLDTPLSPCGILPKYAFSDSFSILQIDATGEVEILVDESNIASEFDKEHKFIKSSDQNESQWLDVTNEHFIVWMQQDTLHVVYRLYGRVNQMLNKDQTYVVSIDNNYDKEIFGGTKKLYLQEINQLGGPNKLLGGLFIGSAIFLVVVQLAFLFLYVVKIANNPGGQAEFYNPDKLSF